MAASKIFEQRPDLSQWVIHFVHGRRRENETSSVCGRDVLFFRPTEANPFEEEVTRDVQEVDDGEPADAFLVLQRIIHDHYIKSGWSFRERKATVYGPFSAVCFTEMPLYALMQYADWRTQPDRVSRYGIAFKRDELFEAGARPVIYGLSSDHREVDVRRGPFRLLHPECGLGIKEQYRYLYTAEGKGWTHEREWRWALTPERYNGDIPGMPLLDGFFSQICVIVQTTAEKTAIEELTGDAEMRPVTFHVIAVDESVGSQQALLRTDDILRA